MSLFGLSEYNPPIEEEIEKTKKLGPFDIIKQIGNKNGFRLDEDNASEYKPFIINKFYSFMPDTVGLAANMTEFSDIDNQLQYDYYYHSMKRGQKFTKWMKGEKDEAIMLISDHYKVNFKRAKEMIALSPGLVDEVKAKYGGAK